VEFDAAKEKGNRLLAEKKYTSQVFGALI